MLFVPFDEFDVDNLVAEVRFDIRHVKRRSEPYPCFRCSAIRFRDDEKGFLAKRVAIRQDGASSIAKVESRNGAGASPGDAIGIGQCEKAANGYFRASVPFLGQSGL